MQIKLPFCQSIRNELSDAKQRIAEMQAIMLKQSTICKSEHIAKSDIQPQSLYSANADLKQTIVNMQSTIDSKQSTIDSLTNEVISYRATIREIMELMQNQSDFIREHIHTLDITA